MNAALINPFDSNSGASLDELLASWPQRVGALRATTAFDTQKNDARHRGIPWELRFDQWWSIWQQSGKWSQRGPGQGYVMCRKGDAGPYAVGNVFIATARENNSDHPRKKSDLPMGVKKLPAGNFLARRGMNGREVYLGVFPTPEQAHAAYLSYGEGSQP